MCGLAIDRLGARCFFHLRYALMSALLLRVAHRSTSMQQQGSPSGGGCVGADCAPTILLMAAPAFVVFDMDDVLARR
eukprot:COSAG04_NODE_9537_length_854_cov_1.517881_2_plen_76_part_01